HDPGARSRCLDAPRSKERAFRAKLTEYGNFNVYSRRRLPRQEPTIGTSEATQSATRSRSETPASKDPLASCAAMVTAIPWPFCERIIPDCRTKYGPEALPSGPHPALNATRVPAG